MTERSKLLRNLPKYPYFQLRKEKPFFKNCSNWFKQAISVAFPDCCVLCDRCVGQLLCERCWKTIRFEQKKSSFFDEKGELTVLSDYSGAIKKCLHEVKFNHHQAIAKLLGHRVCETVDLTWIRDYDSVIPVPIHPKRLKERGFNQVEILFDAVLKRYGIQWTHAVERIHNTPPLFDLNKKERAAVLNKAFRVRTSTIQHCLVVDDICTTGDTLTEIRNALWGAGAKKVDGLVLSRQN